MDPKYINHFPNNGNIKSKIFFWNIKPSLKESNFFVTSNQPNIFQNDINVDNSRPIKLYRSLQGKVT